jgi:hypothetical protein
MGTAGTPVSNNGSGSGAGTGTRRLRTAYTNTQLLELEKEFSSDEVGLSKLHSN